MSIARKCEAVGCGLAHEARGYCVKHYKNLKRHGDHLYTEKRLKEIRDRKCIVKNCISKGVITGKGDERRIHKNGYCAKHNRQIEVHGCIIKTSKDPRPAIIEGDIAKIPLGMAAKDGYAIVDKNMAWVQKYNWRKTDGGYAAAHIKGVNTRMHHVVLKREKGLFTDHINRNKLDNRLENLRNVSRSQNNSNSFHAAKSGYKGVIFNSRLNRKWQAVLGNKSKSFYTKEDAALFYNKLAEEKYGEYAYLNIIN